MAVTALTRQSMHQSSSTLSSAQPIWVWIQISCMAGILGSLAAIVSATELFGITSSHALKIAFSPLIAIAYLGFFAFFSMHRGTPVLFLATIFGVLTGIIANMMVLVSGLQFLLIYREAIEILDGAGYVLNTLQLSLEFSLDLCFALATALLGVVLLGHPRFHKIFALVTSLIGLALLLVNLWSFPLQPIGTGVVSLRSLLGGWYLLISLCVMLSPKGR